MNESVREGIGPGHFAPGFNKASTGRYLEKHSQAELRKGSTGPRSQSHSEINDVACEMANGLQTFEICKHSKEIFMRNAAIPRGIRAKSAGSERGVARKYLHCLQRRHAHRGPRGQIPFLVDSQPRIIRSSSSMAAAAAFERGLQVLARLQLENGRHLVAARGSVVDFRGDAIVNAANEGCVGGGGVDGAINDAGGPALVEARKRLGGCPTGQAKSTPSFRLKPHVKLIVHAVGPAYRAPLRGSVEGKDALLASAYLCALQEAVRSGASSVAFALISAGVFRGPRSLQDVLRIGFRTLLSAMEGEAVCGGTASGRDSAAGGAGSADPAAADDSTNGPLEVFLVAYTADEQEALKQVFAEANSKSAPSAADAPACAAASGGSAGMKSTSMGRSAAAPTKLLPCSRKFSEATEAVAKSPLAVSYAGGVVDIPAGSRYYTDAAGVALIGWCGSYDPPGDMDGESVLAGRY